MRLLISLALAMSAVVAFRKPHQDTPVALAYQGDQMDPAVEMSGEEVMDVSTRRLAGASKMSDSRVRRPSSPSFASRVGQAAVRGREKFGQLVSGRNADGGLSVRRPYAPLVNRVGQSAVRGREKLAQSAVRGREKLAQSAVRGREKLGQLAGGLNNGLGVRRPRK
ncbi:hypothetical protein AC1031_011464 [Aphanomyces cochlioides]|nr:hypothetical protein AC1031_011464 [Aphanomyces cochlioides]